MTRFTETDRRRATYALRVAMVMMASLATFIILCLLVIFQYLTLTIWLFTPLALGVVCFLVATGLWGSVVFGVLTRTALPPDADAESIETAIEPPDDDVESSG